MASVSLINVWKYYGKTIAVKELTLECEDNSFLCILGPSGCGKSSTLRMLAGLEQISAGEIKFGGKRVNDVPPKDRDIAMVFENYALYPHKSVFDNMANPLKLRHMNGSAIESKVRKAAKLLEVPHPAAADRLFVLAPLADLAPGLVPPGWHETVETARRRRASVEGPDAVRPIATWDAGRGGWRRRPEGQAT